jgi:peptide/nickel transport system permease protein
VPVITMTGLQLGSIIAFAIITETRVPVAGHGASVHPGDPVRRHPGDGRLPGADRVVFVVINLIVDMLYVAIDPRLRVDIAGGH